MFSKGVKGKSTVLFFLILSLYSSSQIACESMGVKGINKFIKISEGKDEDIMTFFGKCHNFSESLKKLYF